MLRQFRKTTLRNFVAYIWIVAPKLMNRTNSFIILGWVKSIIGPTFTNYTLNHTEEAYSDFKRIPQSDF